MAPNGDTPTARWQHAKFIFRMYLLTEYLTFPWLFSDSLTSRYCVCDERTPPGSYFRLMSMLWR
ncbi:hypothetical protein DEO72_LG2g5408 [Vigna unguiculata]|uniref:Uncharacterized protein n=1 Tax=Vigna unguiculata TaxID=3917 RepID=A0A4D6L953_VIGUN|nr:hypothetical protein DEO72_LG2g5408 [Vigna unguiculata]